MFVAYGRSITRSAEGIATVTVEFVREADNKPVLTQVYPFTTRPALKTLVDLQLALLKTAEEDATMSAQLVNVQISRI